MPRPFPKHAAVYAKALADGLIAEGYSERRVFRGTGLTPTDLKPTKPMVGVDLIAAFYEHAADLTGDDILGFVHGQKREMRRSGLISYIGMSSPTIRTLLLNLARYRRVFSDAIEIDCEGLDQDGSVEWYFNVPASITRRQFVEFGASGLLFALREVSNIDVRPELVTFHHARNTHLREFEQFFGCKVVFGAGRNSVRFRASDLALPLKTADDELYTILRNCCEQALQVKARNTPPLIVDVEHAISSRLNQGEANQENVARALGMSSRTLSRRLADEGTTFFKSLEALRKALARNYLRDSNLGLAEISFLLGYSGLSSFTDAFKRWTGKTPGQYRLL